MSTDTRTRRQLVLAVGCLLGSIPLLIGTGLLLRAYGPGNMGTGFLQGAAVGLIGAVVLLWRVWRRPDRTTTFERAWTQTGDERDDAVLTSALSVLGLLALPLTGAAAVAIALGAAVEMVLALLLLAEFLVGAISFVVVDRRS